MKNYSRLIFTMILHALSMPLIASEIEAKYEINDAAINNYERYDQARILIYKNNVAIYEIATNLSPGCSRLSNITRLGSKPREILAFCGNTGGRHETILILSKTAGTYAVSTFAFGESDAEIHVLDSKYYLLASHMVSGENLQRQYKIYTFQSDEHSSSFVQAHDDNSRALLAEVLNEYLEGPINSPRTYVEIANLIKDATKDKSQACKLHRVILDKIATKKNGNQSLFELAEKGKFENCPGGEK